MRVAWRIPIRVTMPRPVAHEMNSTKSSYGAKCPSKGIANSGEKSCPYAVTSVRKSEPKPTKTNQCAIPPMLHLRIRVCPSTSRTKVLTRSPRLFDRVGSAWPRRTIARIERTAFAKRARPATVAASEMMMRSALMGIEVTHRKARRESGQGRTGNKSREVVVLSYET
ncbi:unannotated protein [freshwater metagenome]|uniref:Unannotated protein n=1 Tax=freshwater metagenome TaxID=449393 RepID=A0A6J6NSZ7_9ZZZZ